jgi:hypothetical protein
MHVFTHFGNIRTHSETFEKSHNADAAAIKHPREEITYSVKL